MEWIILTISGMREKCGDEIEDDWVGWKSKIWGSVGVGRLREIIAQRGSILL